MGQNDGGERQELAVVVPVYNEEQCIGKVLDDWQHQLEGQRIRYRILVLNDGSTDATARRLAAYEAKPEFEICHHSNSGHGPTIWRGYRRAVALAEWVLQVDGDDELRPEDFQTLWDNRHGHDALLGYRQHRQSSIDRRIVTWSSRLLVRILFGAGIHDVNCPYRLFRSGCLERLLPLVPDDCFAPNVVLSGLLIRHRLSIAQYPVTFRMRQTGIVSISGWRLWRAAWTSFQQLARIAFAVPHRRPGVPEPG